MKKTILIFISILLCYHSSNSNQLYSNLKPVTDKKLITEIFNISSNDSIPIDKYNFYGKYHISIKNDSTNSLILIQNGTEIVRLDEKDSKIIYTKFPFIYNNESAFSQSNIDTITDGKNGKSTTTDSRSVKDILLGFGKWDNNIEFDEKLNLINAGSYFTRLQSELSFTKNLTFEDLKFINIGGSLQLQSHWGTIIDTISNNNSEYSDFFSFSLSVGLPFIKYRLKNSPEMVPHYSWIGNEILPLYMYEKENAAFTIYKDGFSDSRTWNMEHQINFKLWKFHYDLIIDSDTYLSPIHIISFQELGTFFGTWDLKVIKSPTIWIPGFRFTTKTIHISDIKFFNQYYPLSTSIIYTDVFYKNYMQFNIGFGVKFNLGLDNGDK